MQKIRQLNLSELPNVESLSIFMSHDEDVEDRLAEGLFLTEVYERSNAALLFFHKVSSSNESFENSAYLRAGLNEFYGIQDAAKRDFKKNELTEFTPKLSDSLNPLVHLMYLLRHVNVHAKITTTNTMPVNLISNLGGVEHEVAIDIVIMDTPTLQNLTLCGEAKRYYDITELEKASNWLDHTQCHFGVVEVFRRGVSAYCRELLRAAKLV